MSPAGNYVHEHNTQDGTNHQPRAFYKIKNLMLKIVNGNKRFSLDVEEK